MEAVAEIVLRLYVPPDPMPLLLQGSTASHKQTSHNSRQEWECTENKLGSPRICQTEEDISSDP